MTKEQLLESIGTKTTISLRHKDLKDEGAKALADLKTNTTLTLINLSENEIVYDGDMMAQWQLPY